MGPTTFYFDFVRFSYNMRLTVGAAIEKAHLSILS